MLAIEALREAIQKIERSQEVHLNVQRRLDEAAGLMRQCAGDERHAEQTVLDLESRITSARGWYRSCSEDVAAVNQTLGHSRREREGLVTEIESAKVKIAEATKSLERFASPSAPAAIPSPADLKRPGPAIAEKHTAEKALLQAKRAVKRLEEEYLEASLREERATSGGAWRRENAARSQRALAELEKELEKAKAMVSRSRELGRVLYVTNQERDEACDAVWRAISEADAALSEAKRSKATEADSKEITELEGRLAVAKDPLAALPDVVLASIISQCFGDQLAEIAAVGLVSKRWLAASRHPAIWFVAYHDRFRPCITMLSSSIDWFHRYIGMTKARRKHADFWHTEPSQIENCDEPACPLIWEELLFLREGVRHCSKCGKEVPTRRNPPGADEPAPTSPFAVLNNRQVQIEEPHPTDTVILGTTTMALRRTGFTFGQSQNDYFFSIRRRF